MLACVCAGERATCARLPAANLTSGDALANRRRRRVVKMRRNSSRPATPQAVKAPAVAVTEQQSCVIMKNMVRTAISSISYIRNLFPENCFETKNMVGIPTRILLSNNEEAKKLISWLEKGVFDAVNKQYLESLLFSIFSGTNGGEGKPALLESYLFTITYNQGGGMAIKSTHERGLERRTVSVDDIRSASISLVRQLISMCHTLDPLPQVRMLTMRLTYRDDVTPPDYEPEFFRAPRAEDEWAFPEALTSDANFPLGAVTTGPHSISLNLQLRESKQISAGCGVEPGPLAPLPAAQFISAPASAAASESSPVSDANYKTEDDSSPVQSAPLSSVVSLASADASSAPSVPEPKAAPPPIAIRTQFAGISEGPPVPRGRKRKVTVKREPIGSAPEPEAPVPAPEPIPTTNGVKSRRSKKKKRF